MAGCPPPQWSISAGLFCARRKLSSDQARLDAKMKDHLVMCNSSISLSTMEAITSDDRCLVLRNLSYHEAGDDIYWHGDMMKDRRLYGNYAIAKPTHVTLTYPDNAGLQYRHYGPDPTTTRKAFLVVLHCRRHHNCALERAR